MKAILKNYRQSPRKVRLIAGAVRGKKVPHALESLRLLDKKAAGPLQKLIQSAAHNAKHAGKNADDLTVAGITINEGIIFKRWRPRAFGRATPLRKRTSTIHIILQ